MAPSKIRVLVVDDDPDQLLLAEVSLRASGFEVMTHATSFGVSNLVRTTSPDLVLLDVNIPALSGDQVLMLARPQAMRHTQFILYSSADEATLRVLASQSGADGYLTKKVRGAELGQKLLEFFQQRRATMIAGT